MGTKLEVGQLRDTAAGVGSVGTSANTKRPAAGLPNIPVDPMPVRL